MAEASGQHIAHLPRQPRFCIPATALAVRVSTCGLFVFGLRGSELRFSTMSPRVRKFCVTIHVICSVGWLGAVLAYLPLAVTGLKSVDADVVRSVYGAMERIGWFAIVPLSLAALLSGLVQSLATEWGLLRHYWIIAKLGLTLVATAILLLHMPTVSRVAETAMSMPLPIVPPEMLRTQLLVHAAGGVVVLVAITAISVFKPWGRTPFGSP